VLGCVVEELVDVDVEVVAAVVVDVVDSGTVVDVVELVEDVVDARVEVVLADVDVDVEVDVVTPVCVSGSSIRRNA